MRYRFLEGKIAERGIKKKAIADRAHITPKALANKISGKTPFTWNEACVIQESFFPDISKDDLYRAE